MLKCNGECYSLIRRFIELSAEKLGWGTKENPPIIWQGKGLDEIGIRGDNKKTVIRIDENYFRPSEVDSLLGSASKAFKLLDWKPNTSLEELVDDMIKHDLEIAKKDSFLKTQDFKNNNKAY